ncbi:MAG: radical SAM protein [Candidatus Marinimicrobia bacterium]|nr:radical SAM protein [Candidatus Neomarinimicrobiota bacterium]
MNGIGIQTLKYRIKNGSRAVRRWVVPYAQSRIYASKFRPVLGYLYTEWKCNIDCHYCWAYDNTKKGMSIETAKKSVDWLKSTGCRVLALMGGEPLIRRSFILELVEYATNQGLFVYLPTNGRLLTEEFIDKIGKTGIAAINLAIDCVKEIEGLPKALEHIEPQFEYLVKQQEKYGYIIVLNINITSKNLADVKELTEIAHEYGIATDYHINEAPYMEQPHYKHKDTDTYIREEHWESVDQVLDWVIERCRMGYPMVNVIEHLEDMKKFMRGQAVDWKCRAGHNSVFIKADGTLSPCFPLSNANKDWGNISEGFRLDHDELKEQKKECTPHCLSTCQYNVSHVYQLGTRALMWAFKHARMGGRIAHA